jgi:hypothetical protein
MQTKFPFIRHRPTVLDEFPLDVIRVHIFPSLDYETRINLNQCLPPWDRIQKKMDPMGIRLHDHLLRKKHITSKLSELVVLASFDWGAKLNVKLIKKLSELFRLHLDPRYFSYLCDYEEYRNLLLSHFDTILNRPVDLRIPSISAARTQLIYVVNELQRKIEESGPYGPTVDYKHVKRLTFL